MEIWKSVLGYEGLYEVSDLGKVLSIYREVYHPITKIQKVFERILIPDLRKGYFVVTLCKNGKKKSYGIHRLVAKSFLTNDNCKPEVNHKNGLKTDNRVKNLEWVTSSENQIHAVKTGLHKSGSNHINSKLLNTDILEIRCNNFPYKKLSEIYKVSKSTISNIKNFKTYKHI